MTRAHEPARPDLYDRVTQTIVAQLEAGVRPWSQPWAAAGGGGLPLRHDGRPYNGINVVLLWSEAIRKGFTAPIWMTFRQALERGAHARKGECGSTVVYANQILREETSDDGEEEIRRIPFLKAYTVFNVAQIEGLDAGFHPAPVVRLDPDLRIARAETFFAATGAEIRHGGGRAYYAPGPDYVQMPPFECFDDPESYYATLGHELTHWTRHSSRLDRDFGRARHGDAGYAREELVAELGSAFLCAALGLHLEPREDHAAYLASWLEVLKNDHRFIFSAAAHAQRAVGYLQTFQKS
ncbi:ArdC family protein [Brevundimonas bullata]